MRSILMLGGWGGPLVALGLLLAVASARAADVQDQVIRAKLFFKIATYDANLPPAALKIGLVSTKESAEASERVHSGFTSLGDLKVGGRGFSVELLTPKKPAELGDQVKGRGLYGLYLPLGTSDEWIAAAARVAKEQGLFTFAEDAQKVAMGIVAAVEESDAKRVIVLNPTAALEAGRKFDSAFLKVCKIVR